MSPTLKFSMTGLCNFASRTARRIVDLTPFLWGPAFDDIAGDDSLFDQVKADPDTGTIGWPNGADLDPDVLRGDFEPANPTQLSLDPLHLLLT